MSCGWNRVSLLFTSRLSSAKDAVGSCPEDHRRLAIVSKTLHLGVSLIVFPVVRRKTE
jgi:hypothetical protein